MKIKVYPMESQIDRDRLYWVLMVLLPVAYSFEDNEGYVFGHSPEDIDLVFTPEAPEHPGEGIRIDVSVYSDWPAVGFVDRTSMAQDALMLLFLGEDFDLNVEPLSPKPSRRRNEAAVTRLQRRVDNIIDHIEIRITEAKESQTTPLQALSS